MVGNEVAELGEVTERIWEGGQFIVVHSEACERQVLLWGRGGKGEKGMRKKRRKKERKEKERLIKEARGKNKNKNKMRTPMLSGRR